jgi:LCP family protein required for cell wall assembly
VLVAVLAAVAVLAGYVGVRAARAWSAVERVDLAGVLDPVTGDHVNYLLVGSDSREGFDPDVAAGEPSTVSGRRSDTIILLRVGPSGAQMMSIPRDLYVTIADTGEQARINGAYNGGPARLVRTVQDNLDLPVHHYLEVGFASFSGLVDAIGGVTVEFPHPVRDEKSGLFIDTAGPVTLDGRQALAYVRSRNYTEIIDGRPVTDPTADLGRQERQQQFLRTALADVGGTRNPVRLLRAGEAMSRGLTVDASLGAWELAGLARRLGGADPDTVVLPTVPATRGGASVLLLDEPEAQEVLARFR